MTFEEFEDIEEQLRYDLVDWIKDHIRDWNNSGDFEDDYTYEGNNEETKDFFIENIDEFLTKFDYPEDLMESFEDEMTELIDEAIKECC